MRNRGNRGSFARYADRPVYDRRKRVSDAYRREPKYYSASQRSGKQENRTTFSNPVKYNGSFDVATGVNYMGGNATFNGYSGVTTSATLGFKK